MKTTVVALALVSSLVFPLALSSPFDVFRGVKVLLAAGRGDPSLASEIASGLNEELFIDDEHVFNLLGTNKASIWVENGLKFVEHMGIKYQLFSSHLFPNMQARVITSSPGTGLCDTAVTRYSGYVDIEDQKAGNKHFFFWFFESRNDPKNDPVVLWSNGGPGCSSMSGLLSELGPCIARKDGTVERNGFSWNQFANMIFLDQPVNTGFSYSDGTTLVDTGAVAAEDVDKFLRAFYATDIGGKYLKNGLHIASESYGGIFLPQLATTIHDRNKNLSPKIPLQSIVLSNGLTDPQIQYQSMKDHMCLTKPNPFKAINDTKRDELCQIFDTRLKTCQEKIASCYGEAKDGKGQPVNNELCGGANTYCKDTMLAETFFKAELKINRFDISKECDQDVEGKSCYIEIPMAEHWMRNPIFQRIIGATPPALFSICNPKIIRGFVPTGDGARNAALKIGELITNKAGIRTLEISGKLDSTNNYIGHKRWMSKLIEGVAPNPKWLAEFKNEQPWTFGDTVASFMKAGGSATSSGDLALVVVEGAGHMTSYDKPQFSLELIKRWVNDRAFGEVKK